MKEFFTKVWNAIKTAFQSKPWLKWVAIGAAVILTGGIVLGVVACNNSGNGSPSSSQPSVNSSSSSEEEEIFNYMYRVKVQTMDGYGLSGITVHLYDGDREVTSLKTNSSGKATFMDNILPELGQYTIKLTDLPVGYKLADESTVYKTEAIKGMDFEIPLMPTGVIKEAAPMGKVYKLGDVMYDFSLRRADGTTVALSQILEEKDMVFLNFWALRCAPCKQEFPFMNLTYISYYDEEEEIKYSDKIEILAFNNEDTQTNIDTYKNSNSFQFEMLNDYSSGANITKNFNLGAIPVSAIVDRYGVIVSLHTGGLTNVSQFRSIFDPFIGEDYTPKILSEDSETGGGETDEEEIRIKPLYSNPAESEIKTALGNDTVEYLWDKDEYSWPWLIGEDNGSKYIYSSNKGIDNSYAILYMNFTVQANTAICFDLKMETELFGVGLDGDFFHVLLDGTPIHKINGTRDWQTFCAYAFNEAEAGEHELAILYQKDGETSVGDDVVIIKNLRFESVDNLNNDTTMDSYIIRQAATEKNLDEGATTQFKNYITPVYNATDGYYHVNSAEGPVLYANVLGSTSFSMYSMYDLAANGYSIDQGFDIFPDINTMAWESTYNYTYYGYTPVTKQWQNVIDNFVYCTTYTQQWGGEYHENEWLELCVYYDHYGDTPVHEDPLKGVTYNAAIPIAEGTTKVHVPFEMVPRGFKYKFVPTKSGVYNIYSTSESDTLCYLTDERVLDYSISGIYEADSREYMLGEFMAPISSNDGDFNFRYYFEEGKTYYLLLCYFGLTETGSYDVTITYTPDDNRVLTEAGTIITFSESEDGTFYVQDGVNFAYDETDGYYKVKNADDTFGSILYVDTAKPTWYFGGTGSLNDIANGAQTSFELVIDGVDYTDELKALCQQGENNTEMPGYVALTQDVYELLVTLTQGQDEPVENDWLLMCYYWKTLG